MPSLSLLTKTALVAVSSALLCANGGAAQANDFMQHPIQGLKHTWDNVHDVVQDSFSDWLPDYKKPPQQQDEFTTFSHPAFPEYAMRYKRPALCDPNVKQVKKKITMIR